MQTYTATYKGQTETRRSGKVYTHASVVRWSDGTVSIASFHTSYPAAAKGALTAQQRKNGAIVIDVIPATN